MAPAKINLIFQGNLKKLLIPRLRCRPVVVYPLTRRASIKDIIESLRIPHPEVERILAGTTEISFNFLPHGAETLEIFPLAPGHDIIRPSLLRPKPLERTAFLVDINVGKLAVLLRMAGLDARYHPDLTDRKLAEEAARQHRILLSRDRELLKRSIVDHGHLVREEDPLYQLAEVITLYNLNDRLKPFSRCLHCNDILKEVAKETIIHRLEPLTRKYFHRFRQCPSCQRIYWRGSHLNQMQQTVDRALTLTNFRYFS